LEASRPTWNVWSKWGLIPRLMAAVGFAILFGGMIQNYLLAVEGATEHSARQQREVKETLEFLAPLVADQAVLGDYAAIHQLLNNQVRKLDIAELTWTDEKGRKLIAADRSAPRQAPAWFAALVPIEHVDASLNVDAGGAHYGTLHGEMTPVPAINGLWAQFVRQLQIVVAILILMLQIIWLIFRGNLGTLRMLAVGADRFSRGDHSVRVAAAGAPEVRSAAEAFNNMANNIEGLIDSLSQAEAALREANESLTRKAQELARSNSELEQFAYVASHDLQEPLRMISSYTQLIVRRYGERLDSDAREFMDFVVDGAARMKQLIEDLLAYSRVGTHGKQLKPTDCEAVLVKALTNLRSTVETNRAVVTHDALPTVAADGTQLVQLFQNLIGNAIKFRGKPAPAVHISAKEEDQTWLFAVKDNGIGIEPQYFERIFMVFQRLHIKSEYPGTGIGLAICKKVVDRHGGRIWVESRAEGGSCFYFTLPMTGRPANG
jgi:signal transduction histidine kinase